MISIETFTFNDFQENTYVLHDETKECIIVDPGCYSQLEKDQLLNYINNNDLKPVRLINTHCHIDHVLGNKFVSECWGLELEAHEQDLPTLQAVTQYSSLYGFHNYEESPLPLHFLNEGDLVSFGQSYLTIMFTPGHAPGHIVLYSKEQDFVIGGDVLFQMSIGRTDLPGGDHQTLINSIKNKLMPLEDKTKVYCGHGPSTTVGFERKNNPFLN
ncbi:MAG: MBL fold metallo-hydrolase [Flavobacteriales bacterium]